MKTKVFLLLVSLAAIFLVVRSLLIKDEIAEDITKSPIFKVALVSDLHSENTLLAKALADSKVRGVDMVIGLGDWSEVGTVEELTAAKSEFDKSGLKYVVTAGDHDLWDGRDKTDDPLVNFRQVFGESTHEFEEKEIYFFILDNSDIYKGISSSDERKLESWLKKEGKLKLLFSHKTPFHPESSHIMGENSSTVSAQAEKLVSQMQNSKVDGFFSGDLHFFAQFKSPDSSVRITTIGAAASARNFQGPRFGILTVYSDYSFEVEDIEII